MYGRISDLGTGHFPPRVALALQTPGWEFHTVRGGIDPGDPRLVPGLLVLYISGRIYDPRMIRYPPRVALALQTPG